MKVNIQDLYDIAVVGKKVHRGTLKTTAESLINARLYEPLDNITLKYVDENGVEQETVATATDEATTRVKILALFVQCQKHDYSRSSREQLKDKLGLYNISCSNYMPEIIDGKHREWSVDNLKDAIAALLKEGK